MPTKYIKDEYNLRCLTSNKIIKAINNIVCGNFEFCAAPSPLPHRNI